MTRNDMRRKYTKANPLPRAELTRLRRNTNRRILRRKKAQTAQKTLQEFENVLVAAITMNGKKLNDTELALFEATVKQSVKEFAFAENDAAVSAARKLKSLFLEYELTKQDLLAAVERTEWARLNNEILELEVKKGMDENDAGYYITLETKEDMEIFFANIKRRGLQRLKAKQNLKDQSVK
jgi:predicted O-linked N-acetylglucosamine transferase (SPINDLY family)